MNELKDVLDQLWSIGTQLDAYITNTDFNAVEDGESALYVLQRTLRMIDETATNVMDVLKDSFNEEA